MTTREKLEAIAKKAGYRIVERWRGGLPHLGLDPVRQGTISLALPALERRGLRSLRRLAKALKEVEG